MGGRRRAAAAWATHAWALHVAAEQLSTAPLDRMGIQMEQIRNLAIPPVAQPCGFQASIEPALLFVQQAVE